jgi:hypothetical protein
MTNDEGSPNAQIDENSECSLRHLDLVILSSLAFVIRHFQSNLPKVRATRN